MTSSPGARASTTPVSTGAPRRIQYTDEQQGVIESQAPICVVKAFAGTGKTTTAVGRAAARPRASFLYVAFTKANQLEAAKRFGPNTRCQTSHSLAYQAVGRDYTARINKSWKALAVRSEMGLPTYRSAAMTQTILQKFFQSADPGIDSKHAVGAETVFGASDREVVESLTHAKALWRRMQDRSDVVSVPDDAYFKMWALSDPRLPFDEIIFDEYQDSNEATADIIRRQRHANLLYIGDPHQSIYGFRGATNAMDQLTETTHLHLSQTWRFGPKTAEFANHLLREFKGETIDIQGMGHDVPYVSGAQVTKLSRTNAQLFKDATLRLGRGIHWVGGVDKYRLDKILDTYHLFTSKREAIRDSVIRGFASFAELTAYAEEARDPELRILSEVIEEYRHEIPSLIKQVTDNAVLAPADADLILTTGHKAKGLDWDYVQLADDFEILMETEAALAADPYATIEEQEINLLYVVATRAKKACQLNTESATWLANLDKHRRARQVAKDRQRARSHSPIGTSNAA